MKQDHLHCAPCPYYKRGYVQGEGPLDSKLLFIGEAPGQDESFRSHRPFTGPAGMELDRFLKAIRISREDIYLTNLVKCVPPGNEDPVPEVIKRCSHYLEQEIVQVQPSTIVTVGGVALHYFLPNTNLEMIWGIPQELNHSWVSQLFPLYHPALGLHQTRMLPMIEEGFNRLGLWLSGNPIWEEDTVKTVYLKLPKAESSWNTFYNIAVDTETTWDGHPLYIQMSGVEGVAMLAEGKMEGLKEILERSDLTVLMHNSMFDLGVLHKLDIHPSRVVDTMVMAYLLGDLPQGLKALAYRLCGMEMRDYQEVVGDRGQDKAKEYLELAAIIPWPDPPHVLEFKDGEPHVRKPQNITKKILRALKDAEKGTVDLQERWGKMEGREEVEGEMGVMPGADLRDVPEDKAIHYACRDADATRRIYPILKRRIKDEGLEGVLEMDMGVIPMVLEMQRVGIKVDPTEMGKVDVLLEHKMMVEEREIQKLLGYHINPGSPPQVAAMMDKEGIEVKKRRGKSGQQSTGKEFLAPLRKIYPVIDHIMMWSSYETLRSTFTNVLPNLIGTDGRIHTTIKVTRTSTGRLAMENPSLQNIPVRSEEGRMIRDAFVAEDGYGLCSFDYCLAGGTKIITNRGEVPIMHVEVGDGVLSVVDTDGPKPTLTLNTVKKIVCVGVQEMWEVGLEDESTVRCTSDHKWRGYHGGWVKTSDLKVGDRLSHVKEGRSGRYPTWYIYTHCNYRKKHTLTSEWKLGPVPDGYHCDHKDEDYLNWKSDNLQYIPKGENYSQGGKRYWKEVKNGDRSDEKRLAELRKGLKRRRAYMGEGNPNFGKRKANHRVAWVVRVASERAYQITVAKDHNYVLANGLVSKNSQIELRILAHMSRDVGMINAFLSGYDLHTATASEMFGIPMDQVGDYEHRRPAKTVNFGIPYGITAMGLMDTMNTEGAQGWTEDSCQDLINRWFRARPGVDDFMEECKAHARRYGYITDMFGRRRWTPEVHSSSKKIVEEGLRYAMNQPIQSGAQGVIKLAMARIWKELLPYVEPGVVRPLLQIHDDLLFEVREKEAGWVIPVIQGMMEGVVKLSIPAPVDPKVGERWGSMKKVISN